MILADASVWIDHLHRHDRALEQLLTAEGLLTHPLVIGEIAVGNWPDRVATLDMLRDLPVANVAEDEEVLRISGDFQLFGCGIGYGDAHLLGSVLLTSGSRLWTRDRALRKVAKQLAVDAGLS